MITEAKLGTPRRFVPARRPGEPADGTPVVIGFGGPVTTETLPTTPEILFERYAWIVDQAVNRIPLVLLSSANLEADDLRQEGMLGLLTAVKTFDRSKGARFTPFARTVVTNAIYGALRSHDPLPESTRRDLRALGAYIEEHENRFHSQPTIQEMARGTGLSENRVRSIRQQASVMTSLQVGDGEEDGSDPNAPLVHERLEDVAFITELSCAWQRLDERTRRIMWSRVVEGQTVREVAQREKLSIGRVSQIQARAVQALRAMLASAGGVLAVTLLRDCSVVVEHIL